MDGLQQPLRTAERLGNIDSAANNELVSARVPLTVCKNFDTTGGQAAITSADELLSVVAPVFLGLVEVCHAVDANLRDGKE